MSDWRPMLVTDVAVVHALSKIVHPDFPESRAVFTEKRKLYASGCFVLGPADSIAGYAFSHPWMSGSFPKLDALLGNLPESPDALFIHDVALREDVRGTGRVLELLRLFDYNARARGLEKLSLVAVSGTRPYWQRAAFIDVANGDAIASAVAGYGAGAIAMERVIPA